MGAGAGEGAGVGGGWCREASSSVRLSPRRAMSTACCRLAANQYLGSKHSREGANEEMEKRGLIEQVTKLGDSLACGSDGSSGGGGGSIEVGGVSG